MRWVGRCAVAIVFAFANTAVAHADPPKLVECPDHTHVWDESQCKGNNPFGLPGAGQGHGGSGGLLGLIGHLL